MTDAIINDAVRKVQSIRHLKEKMQKQMARIPGNSNVKLSIEGSNPELFIRLDKGKRARLVLKKRYSGG